MKVNPDSLRKRMGIIFQDFNKYELTLRENIGFGDIEKMNNDEKIIKTLKRIQDETEISFIAFSNCMYCKYLCTRQSE